MTAGKMRDPVADKAARKRLKDEVLKACADIRVFFDERGGRIVGLTDDSPFAALLRSFARSIGSRTADIVFVTQDRELYMKECAKTIEDGRTPFFIIEESMRGGASNGDILRRVARAWPNFQMFPATTSQDHALYAYLRETGADGIVVKPADSNSLTLCVASGVRPRAPEEALIDKSLELSRGGMGDEALRIAATVVKARPENARGYLAFGDAMHARGDDRKAKAAWTMSCKKDDQMLAPMGRLSELARKEGDLEQEILWLVRMDRVSPMNGERKASIADACLRAGKLEMAANFIDQAWRRIDEDLRPRLRALSEDLAGKARAADPAMAERHLRKCIDEKKGRLGLEDIHLFNQLGLVLRKQGKSADAIREYRRALKIDPDSPELLYNLAMAMAENYDRAGACAVMGRALALSERILESGPNTARNMAFIFLSEKDYGNAEICLEAALDASPGDAQIASLLERVRAANSRS